jgi:hypothetical protein
MAARTTSIVIEAAAFTKSAYSEWIFRCGFEQGFSSEIPINQAPISFFQGCRKRRLKD